MNRRKVSFNDAIARVIATKERDAKRAAMFGELVEALKDANEMSKLYPQHPGMYAQILAKAKELQ